MDDDTDARREAKKQRAWKVCVQPVEWRELKFEELMWLTRDRPGETKES
jgi:hypothetical protein